MGQTVVLSDNLYNVRIYPLHVVSAEEEPAGFEAFRVASGRRSGLSYATATTANSDWWVRVVCDRLRSANVLVLDRGHNLATEAIKLQWSPDNVAWSDVVNVTALPSAPGGTLDATYGTAGVWGVVTEEGAWVVRFPTTASVYWRFFSTAMGANLKPVVPGLWLGLALQTQALTRPVARNAHQLIGESQESDLGWQGFAKRTPRREGTLPLRFLTLGEAELARLHLEGQYGRGRPTWIIPDDANATDAFCAVCPAGGIGIVQSREWFYGNIDLPYSEHEPAEVA
jgi:hypothetical protein